MKTDLFDKKYGWQVTRKVFHQVLLLKPEAKIADKINFQHARATLNERKRIELKIVKFKLKSLQN